MDNVDRQVLAQKYQLNAMLLRKERLIGIAKNIEEDCKEQCSELDNLEDEIDELLNAMNLSDNQIDNIEYIDILSEEEKIKIKDGIEKFESINSVKYNNQFQYQGAVDDFLRNQGFDIENDPMLELFSAKEINKVLSNYEANYGKLRWHKSDFIVIGLVGVLSILIDYFIVSIPEDMNFLGKDYKGSAVTKKIKEITTQWYENKDSGIGKWLKKLEEYAKVPYDVAANNKTKEIRVDGLSPNYHRLMELGHDPILGFIVGVIDILRGTCTIIDKNGVVQLIQNGEGNYNIFSAFLKVFAHLLSDVFTKTGLPCPFMSLLQLWTGKSPFILKKDGERVTFNNVARFMYGHGYDMRHFATMGIETLFIEISIRTYYNMYYFDSLLDLEKDVRHKLKKSNMLVTAHTVAAGGDILKMWSFGWNPVAFNYTEFLGLILSIMKAVKSNGKYENMVAEKLTDEWVDILKN